MNNRMFNKPMTGGASLDPSQIQNTGYVGNMGPISPEMQQAVNGAPSFGPEQIQNYNAPQPMPRPQHDPNMMMPGVTPQPNYEQLLGIPGEPAAPEAGEPGQQLAGALAGAAPGAQGMFQQQPQAPQASSGGWQDWVNRLTPEAKARLLPPEFL